MNRKLASITVSALALAGVCGGAVAALDGDDADPRDQPAAFGQALTIDVDARDTAGRELRGVDIQLVDVNGKVIDTDTTDAAGEAVVSVGVAGQYRIVADPPAGYTDRDDTDGNSASTTRVNCTDVLRCTHVDVAATSFSFPFAINDTTAWFEFVPPPAPVTAVVDGSAAVEDERIGGDDVRGRDADTTSELDATATTPATTPPPPPATTPSTTAPPTTAPPTTTPDEVVDTGAADEAFAVGYEDGYVAGFEGLDLYAPVPGYEADYAEGYAIGSEVGSADQWELQMGEREAFEVGFSDGYSAGHEGLDLYAPVPGHQGAYDEGYAAGMESAWSEIEAQELPIDEPVEVEQSPEAEAASGFDDGEGYPEAEAASGFDDGEGYPEICESDTEAVDAGPMGCPVG